jgi:putative (di)nucleoside polyphosphate hydrolase
MTPDSFQNPDTLIYRKGVGVMILNNQGEVLVGQRVNRGNLIGIGTWQMPQGGIEAGESPYEAALREMKEEITTTNVKAITESRNWISYDFPLKLRTTLWGGRYFGQTQKWFLMRFLGNNEEINIHTPYPEFAAWQWTGVSNLCNLIVPFKRDLYANILEEFKGYL